MFKCAYSFIPFFQRLSWCEKTNKPIKIKPHFIFSNQRLLLILLLLLLYYNQPGHSSKDIRNYLAIDPEP